ncbi:hypothetical protein [Mitsuaria sp. 7]|uniref:hypothetical protein n=1 Tax=Mitsuaria sp. 7 TaxID=1658665 RepID=UPI0007DDE51C|nr:hypothetical protein [Mitsuaria sp. 7]ANH67400.1 hypothetical protein ABE85_07135 [Mitsuaria sp. 7]
MTTQILGDEFDEALRLKLGEVLRQSGARMNEPAAHALGGSQESVSMVFDLDGEVLTVMSETYIGLSIHGPEDLVLKIRRAVLDEP